MPRASDIVFFSLENWDSIWRRNQFVCAGLGRRHPDLRILYVGLPRDLSNGLKRGRLDAFRDSQARRVEESANIWLYRPLKVAPNSTGIGRRLNQIVFRRQLLQVAESLEMRSPLLWINDHSAAHLLGRMNASRVIYDVTDDWTELTQSDHLRRRIIEQDARLCRAADETIVCSQRLFELKQRLTNRVHLIPNGVDVNHYADVLDQDAPLPPDAADWAHPVVGYTGTCHPDRLDCALLEAVARKMKSGTLVLIGPDHLPADVRRRLIATNRVRILGPMPYMSLPQFMRAFDVCMVPHRVTPFTESLNPIKLWEYLAAGKPIVSTNIAGFRDFPQHVRIANTADEFISAIEAALSERPEAREARRVEAKSHSWDLRIDEIERVLWPGDRQKKSDVVGTLPHSMLV